MRTASRRAVLWILALLVPSAYSAGEVGRALAAPQTQRTQTTASADGDVTWDFETGDLRGWTPAGTAFTFQPTRGESPRSRQSASNHQGEYWISTYEGYQGRRGATVGTIQGDRPQGTLESQTFEIPPGPLSFLIGGGSEFATRVELVVISEIEGESRVLHATGNDSDAMQRVTWDLTPFAGRRGRIRIVDASSGDWGHINVDDIRFASVTVPNVIGRDEAAARRVLEARGLTVGTVEPVESRVAEGRVLAQNPAARARVEPGTPIDLGVAELERVTVPNLVGRGGTEVDRLLARAELMRGQIRREESRQPEGAVVSQEPAANTRVPIETAVDLVVAVPVTVLVPDLVGRGGADGGRLLVDAELRRGRVRREESRQPEGTVLSQSPAASERVAIDTAVNLVVATPVTVLVPDLVGQDMTAVDSLLRDTELRRGRTTTEESRKPEGTVLSHEPAANRRVAVETEVDLVVATPVMVLVPDLVSLDEAAVDALLRHRELARGTVGREESRQPVGTVLTQEPAAGTRVVINTPVAFALAVRLTVVMPDVAGLTEAEALDLLDQYELGIG
ncbi:MAG: PASTA domain-containing protein, partial [Vicinamibacterales bacterium]